MKLRTAIKICRIVYDLRYIKKFVKSKYKFGIISKARRVCQKHDNFKKDKIPSIPSDEELWEQANMFGHFILDLVEESGQEVDGVRDDFSTRMDSCKKGTSYEEREW